MKIQVVDERQIDYVWSKKLQLDINSAFIKPKKYPSLLRHQKNRGERSLFSLARGYLENSPN